MPKFDLLFSPPLLNAAGMLGYAPDMTSSLDLARLGAFVTQPVSLAARSPARGTRLIPFSGGFLLHTGYPNPGLKTVIQRCAARWARSPLPVIVHLLVRGIREVTEMAQRLEALEGVTALEIGLPVEIDSQAVSALTAAAAWGELPVIVRLPLEQAVTLAPAALSAGAAAVSLGPPRGMLYVDCPHKEHLETSPLRDSCSTGNGVGDVAPSRAGMAEQNGVMGRLYGPAIFPQAMRALQALAQNKIPVIGAGGVYRPQDIDAMLAAGAMAVQIDSALWRGL